MRFDLEKKAFLLCKNGYFFPEGATKEQGQVLFLVKWVDTDEADLVTGDEAKKRVPQVRQFGFFLNILFLHFTVQFRQEFYDFKAPNFECFRRENENF